MKYFSKDKFIPEKLDPLNIDVLSVSFIPNGSKVLEIGCADGVKSDYLINSKKCQVTGIEIDKQASKIASKRGLNMITGNIEEERVISEIKSKGKFDCLLATAVIEHLADPWQALQMWQNFLKADGFLVISTSNILHWSARLKFLFGKFDYEEYGLLDNTHLRFFTYDSFRKLIEDCGFKVLDYKIDPVGGGLPKLSKALSNFFPGLFTYQMVIKAKKL